MRQARPPRRTTAIAWLRLLPPGVVTSSDPNAVSPAPGRYGTRTVRSTFARPTKTTSAGTADDGLPAIMNHPAKPRHPATTRRLADAASEQAVGRRLPLLAESWLTV